MENNGNKNEYEYLPTAGTNGWYRRHLSFFVFRFSYFLDLRLFLRALCEVRKQ
jgi:hypothetical protein